MLTIKLNPAQQKILVSLLEAALDQACEADDDDYADQLDSILKQLGA